MRTEKDWPNGCSFSQRACNCGKEAVDQRKQERKEQVERYQKELLNALETMSPEERASFLSPIMTKYKAYYV